jgi:hypothetical protein
VGGSRVARFKRLDSRRFEAVSRLFHRAMACPECQTLRLPEDLGKLLEMARRQQEAFRDLRRDGPPTERLRALGGLQFRVLAALYHRRAQDKDGAQFGTEDSMALLYAGMIRRLLAQAGGNLEIRKSSDWKELDALAASFDSLQDSLEEPLRVGLKTLLEQCAGYLSSLALCLYGPERLKRTA